MEKVKYTTCSIELKKALGIQEGRVRLSVRLEDLKQNTDRRLNAF